MAGSIIGVAYQRDNGAYYALNRDESNSRGVASDSLGNTNIILFLPAPSPFVGTNAPQGFKPRYANAFLQSDPRVRRQFPVGNPAALTILSQPGAIIQAAIRSNETLSAWTVTSLRGERGARNVNFGNDTGQDDGTRGPGVTGSN